jgi:Mor family transcriptional regulator
MRAPDLIELIEPVVGFDTALTLAEMIAAKWGGSREVIFGTDSVRRIIRNQQIYDLSADGLTTEDVAEAHGLSERQALRIIGGGI